MSVPSILDGLTGRWTGTNVLLRPWLEGPEAEVESASHATVSRVVNDTFLSIAYDWSLDGKRQEGLLLVSAEPAAAKVHAVWTDSWHLRDQAMHCTGSPGADAVDVFGTYVVPGHPDWGWRTVLTARDGTFELLMYNVTPAGEEAPAVRCRYAPAR